MEYIKPNSLERMILSVMDDPDIELPNLSVAVALKQCSGLSEKVMDRILQEIPPQLVSDTLRIDNHLLESSSENSFSVAQYEALLGLCRIWSLLQLQNSERQKISLLWLNTAKRPLKSHKPVDLLHSSAGRESVLDMLERMERGDFS